MAAFVFLFCFGVFVGEFLETNCLNNGLGLTPPMGYSSWNDVGSEVTEAHIKNITNFLITSGLANLGYVHVNVDEGWLKGRNETTGEIYEDLNYFPSGMKGLGTWIHEQEVPGLGAVMKYGLYTCRGTCQCGTPQYLARCVPSPRSAPNCEGSNGYEYQDAAWMVDAGMDYLKEDSCCGSQDHATAFADYIRMRDALDATGKDVYFSLCGWEEWYAPVGYGIANQWRIAGDGSSWPAMTNIINTMASITQWGGPGGWNDADLLISQSETVGGITIEQSRSQMTLWSIFPAPLIISADLMNISPYEFETWSNQEAIAVNQDPLGRMAVRVLGDDLGETSGFNVWAKQLHDDSFAIAFVNNNPETTNVTCDPMVCFGAMGIPSESSVAVRDLWSHTDNGTVAVANGLSVLVPPNGGTVYIKAVPLY